MKRYKNMVTLMVMGIMIFGLSLAFLCTPSKAYTYSERRSLAQKPPIQGESLANGSFMSDFETFTQDQFPLRDTFRTVKALAVKYVFLQKDNNGFYQINGQIAKLEYPLNEVRLQRNIARLSEIQKNLLEGTDCQLYLSIIPDKNYFLAEENNYPSIDYMAMIRDIVHGVPSAKYIDITSLVGSDDFYATDQHWRQEKVVDVAQAIFEAMGGSFSDDFIVERLETPFYGTYTGQAALPTKPDEILYLTNEMLENCRVTSYNTGSPKEISMYTLQKAEGMDAYEIFLNGADSLLVIENPEGEEGKELVVFRDSFGSSLVPLLVQDYAKVTVVDLRYMNAMMLPQMIEFTDQDVLFLYSTLIMNNNISQ